TTPSRRCVPGTDRAAAAHRRRIGYDRRMGEPGYRYAWWRRLSLWLLLVLSPSLAAAVELEVRELRDDPPVAEVLAGLHDARLLPPRDRPYLKQPTRSVQWWRVAARGPVAAGDRPQLLLRSPYLYRVEAWA